MKKLFFIFIITISAFSVFAADGDPDTSFAGSGFVNEAFYGGILSRHNSVVIQPDGKIIAAGQSNNNVNFLGDFSLVRYNPNGTLDTGFGTGGKVYADYLNKNDSFPVLLLQPDGKILLVGISKDSADRNIISIFRFNTNGTLDTSFGTNGVAVSNFTTSGSRGDTANDAILQPDGKIVVTGAWQGTAFCVGRFNSNGAVDNSFGTNGNFCATTSPVGTGLMNSIDLQPNGKIVVGGEFATSFTSPFDFIVFRFNANGSLDTTFDGDGYAITDFNSSYDEARSIHVLADGKILATGRSGINGSPQYNFGLARYNANGSLDSSFDGDGKAVAFADNTPGSEDYSSVVMSNGKIVVGRYRTQPSPGISTDGQLARFNSNGSVDTSFGANGLVTNSILKEIRDLILQPDGKLVAVGWNQNNTSITARFLNTDTAPPVNNSALRIADFDGDGKTDISTFRSSNATWYINPSGNPSLSGNIAPSGFYGVQFGISTDITVPADYDGDGKSDIAVFRGNPGNPDRSVFYILSSQTNTVRVEQFGRSGDNPTISGDWDGDGKADLAVYRPDANGGQSYFFYRPSSQSGVDFVTLYWGIAGDTPIFGDFDGDRKLDATVYRPGENAFYVRRSSDGTMLRQQWGIAADDAIFAGDFDGDGKSDFAVYRFIGADAGTWYILQSGANPAFRAVRWGLGSDLPVPADYDGDGKTDFAVFRRSDRVWYILNNASGTSSFVNFGLSSDFPLPLNLVR